MARPRKEDGLRWSEQKQSWCARATLTIEGVKVRKVVCLETDNREMARAKLAMLEAEDHASVESVKEDAATPTSMTTYAETWLDGRKLRGIDSEKDERRNWDLYWADALGHLSLSDVRSHHIRATLQAAAKEGAKGKPLSSDSIRHIRGVVLRMLDAAWRDELIAENPVSRVKTRDMVAQTERKDRAVLTDDEFRILLADPDRSPEIKMLALLSRTIGGMRAGDLNALDWTSFGENFATCRCPAAQDPQEARDADVGGSRAVPSTHRSVVAFARRAYRWASVPMPAWQTSRPAQKHPNVIRVRQPPSPGAQTGSWCAAAGQREVAGQADGGVVAAVG